MHQDTGMGTRRMRHWQRMAAMVAIAVSITACSGDGPESQLRSDMEAAGLSNESIDCLIDAFDISSLDDLDDLAPTSDAASSECVGQVFAELFAGAFDEAFEDLATGEWDATRTDVATRDDMETLVEQCRDGDNAACDDLWLVSPIGSPEEELAESCGGRSSEPRMGSCEFWLDD